MSLSEYQKSFSDYVLTKTPSSSFDLSRYLKSDSKINGEGLEIYRRQIVFGAIDHLESVFEKVLGVLSKENFHFLCREYTYAFLPNKNTWDEFGEHFADFLGGRSELKEKPWVRDLAMAGYAEYRLLKGESIKGQKAPMPDRSLLRGHRALRFLHLGHLVFQMDKGYAEKGESFIVGSKRGEEVAFLEVPSKVWQALSHKGYDWGLWQEEALLQDLWVMGWLEASY